MSSDNLTKGRLSINKNFYHVTPCTYKRKPVFINFDYARILVTNMMKIEHEKELKSYAFVVMPDHLHWLFQLQTGVNLSNVMKKLKARVSKEIHQTNQQKVWQDGFYDHYIRNDEDLKNTARYIVANPLRAKLVTQLSQYPWWDAIWL